MTTLTTFEYPSLSFYTELAKKTINKFGSKMYIGLTKEMLSNEDAIADVAHALMVADWKYDDKRVGRVTGKQKTRYSYRNQCALWAIQTYATKAKKKKNYHFSLDNYIDNEEESCFESVLADESQLPALETVINQEKIDLTNDLLKNIFDSNILTDKQSKQVYLYYIEGMTLQDIGDQFNVTREAVRQSIKNAILKLRDLLTNE